MNKRTIFFIFGILFVGLMSVLIYGVFYASDPKEIPSVLIDLPAEDFEFTSFKGENHQLSDFRGKPIVLNFWASWCPPCREDSQILEKAYLEYEEEGVVFLGIAVGDTEEKARKMAKELNKTFTLAMDAEGGAISINYGVVGIPETFYIGKDFMIKQKIVGVNKPKNLHQFLDEQIQ